ncbi:competence/damage-inducible protein A [Candidatus Sumerlaeota bacterium]|nr:competence/damage-inducible protein A [Candidatus Sumerlaeota bacterium]
MTAPNTTAEIISTGTEILQGLYPDTNAQYLSKVLNEQGIQVVYHTAVGDDADALRSALQIASQRADIVIIGGGLGPTQDDVTRDVVAEFVNKPLLPDSKAEEWIKKRLTERGIPLQDYILRQSCVPADSLILYNYEGTAPGFIIPATQAHPCIIALPGPPREMHPMVERDVIPFIKKNYAGAVFIRTHIIHTIGVPESFINTSLRDLFTADKRVTLALLAKVGMVDIRLTISASSSDELNELSETFPQKILKRLNPEDVYGFDDDTLELSVGRLLIDNKLRVACAESCTGGFLSMRLTNVSGSSAYITENYVTYSNDAKIKVLGVKAQTLANYGAVSSQTAYEMADGVRRLADADIGISITGIAGPTGGSAEKPVGLVYFGLATKRGVSTYKRQFYGNRHENRLWSTDFALDLIRRSVLNGLNPEISFRFFNTD